MRMLLPDDVLLPYERFAERQSTTVDVIVAAQLRRFAHLEPGHKALVIQADLASRLEAPLGGLPFKDGPDLARRIEAHAALKFEGIDLQLTPGQKLELAARAEKQGKPVRQLVEEIATTLMRDLFYNVAGPSAEPVRQSA